MTRFHRLFPGMRDPAVIRRGHIRWTTGRVAIVLASTECMSPRTRCLTVLTRGSASMLPEHWIFEAS